MTVYDGKTALAEIVAERNMYKGKYRAMLKLVNKTRDQLVHVTDHIQDEGDRRYFGSTNDADALRDLYDEMDSWVWDALDKHNQMKSDPYADIPALIAPAPQPIEPPVSPALDEVRRAVIEEAMTAVCGGCKKGAPINEFGRHEEGDGYTTPCHAADIRALAGGAE